MSRAESNALHIRQFLRTIRRKPPADLDQKAQAFHDEGFGRIDCLECAHCCSTTSPIFRDIDIERISKKLRMKPSDFTAMYLRQDEDGDWVLQESPCAFLMPDNKCMIYDFRPQACREYPHTNRKRFHQIATITEKNTRICPIAALVVERLMDTYK